MSSKSQISISACIYCSGAGPFTIEHVIPAGLGGDDKRFLLRGMVCKTCNTNILSPLELDFLRKAPAALGRIFLQPEGRKRGKSSNPPKIEARAKTLITVDGYPVEIELGSHARPIVLPQLVLLGDRECQTTGSNSELLCAFVEEAKALLVSTVTCVHGEKVDGVRALRATTYTWSQNRYQQADTQPVSKPPSQCIWNVALETNADGGEPTSRARMFRRESGQIVLRVTVNLGVDRALSFFRKALEQISFETMTVRDTPNPVVQLQMSFQMDVIGRVLAKIGINLLAHLLGNDYVMHPQFQRTKRAILTGTPGIQLLPPEQKASISTIFSGLPTTKHGFLIAVQPGPSRTCSIVLVTKLYGAQIEMVFLGEMLPRPNIAQHTFFAVDYQTHRIEQLEMMDFVRKFPFRPATNGT